MHFVATAVVVASFATSIFAQKQIGALNGFEAHQCSASSGSKEYLIYEGMQCTRFDPPVNSFKFTVPGYKVALYTAGDVCVSGQLPKAEDKVVQPESGCTAPQSETHFLGYKVFPA
ncbi:hypothetical protein GQ53DRAFT_853711 [Thozetella sp. PMI_491]|nr:hypothetical protein GQ53DRAFT_853711 [Thozetella sp. PMI_491]